MADHEVAHAAGRQAQLKVRELFPQIRIYYILWIKVWNDVTKVALNFTFFYSVANNVDCVDSAIGEEQTDASHGITERVPRIRSAFNRVITKFGNGKYKRHH